MNSIKKIAIRYCTFIEVHAAWWFNSFNLLCFLSYFWWFVLGVFIAKSKVIHSCISSFWFLHKCVRHLHLLWSKILWQTYLPAIVAAVSSASRRSFSSCRFSSSRWCFRWSSSMTLWWDSSMAAKPLSQVACEKGNTGLSAWVSGHGPWGFTPGKGPKTSRPYKMSQRWSWRSCFQQMSCKLQVVSHKWAEPAWVWKSLRGMRGYTIHLRLRREGGGIYILPCPTHIQPISTGTV